MLLNASLAADARHQKFANKRSYLSFQIIIPQKSRKVKNSRFPAPQAPLRGAAPVMPPRGGRHGGTASRRPAAWEARHAALSSPCVFHIPPTAHRGNMGGYPPKTPNDWEKRGSYKYYQKGKLGEELSSETPMIAPNPDYYHKTKIWGFRGLCPGIWGYKYSRAGKLEGAKPPIFRPPNFSRKGMLVPPYFWGNPLTEPPHPPNAKAPCTGQGARFGICALRRFIYSYCAKFSTG